MTGGSQSFGHRVRSARETRFIPMAVYDRNADLINPAGRSCGTGRVVRSRMLFARASTVGRGGARHESADQHGYRGEDRERGRRFACCIAGLANHDFGRLFPRDHVVHALLSLIVGQARTFGEGLAQDWGSRGERHRRK